MRQIILFALLGCVAAAAEGPRFQTVSFTPNRSGSQAFTVKVQAKPDPVKLTMLNVSLHQCLQHAYSVKQYQVSGPAWVKSARYDIVATLPPGTAPDQVWPALQALLTERLQVSVRREQKELPTYALTVAKDGPKLQRPAGSSISADPNPTATVRLDHASLEKFSDELSRKTNRPVIDATGIPGTFDFDLRYSASLSSALQRQLGLKLEKRKAPVDILIVDHAVRTPAGL
jgi:uncharacterized protein (TIGR03435 family)